MDWTCIGTDGRNSGPMRYENAKARAARLNEALGQSADGEGDCDWIVVPYEVAKQIGAQS